MPCDEKYFERYILQQYANTVARYCDVEIFTIFRNYYVVKNDTRVNDIINTLNQTYTNVIDQPLLYLNYGNDVDITAALVVFTTQTGEDCNGDFTEILALYYSIENWPIGLVPSTKSCKPIVLPDEVVIGPLNRLERNQTIPTEKTVKNRYYDDGYFDYFNYENGGLLQTDNNVEDVTTPVRIENVTKSVKRWACANTRLVCTNTPRHAKKISLKNIFHQSEHGRVNSRAKLT